MQHSCLTAYGRVYELFSKYTDYGCYFISYRKR